MAYTQKVRTVTEKKRVWERKSAVGKKKKEQIDDFVTRQTLAAASKLTLKKYRCLLSQHTQYILKKKKKVPNKALSQISKHLGKYCLVY